MTWVRRTCSSDKPITDEISVELSGQDPETEQAIEEFSVKLFSILISCTEDDACRIVNSVDNEAGLEAYRLLMQRYEPRTAGTKRAILKSIVNNPQCKKTADMEGNLMNSIG